MLPDIKSIQKVVSDGPTDGLKRLRRFLTSYPSFALCHSATTPCSIADRARVLPETVSQILLLNLLYLHGPWRLIVESSSHFSIAVSLSCIPRTWLDSSPVVATNTASSATRSRMMAAEMTAMKSEWRRRPSSSCILRVIRPDRPYRLLNHLRLRHPPLSPLFHRLSDSWCSRTLVSMTPAELLMLSSRRWSGTRSICCCHLGITPMISWPPPEVLTSWL